MYFLYDLWKWLTERQKYWLVPIILLLLIVGGLLIFTSGSAIAPFVYTLF